MRKTYSVSVKEPIKLMVQDFPAGARLVLQEIRCREEEAGLGVIVIGQRRDALYCRQVFLRVPSRGVRLQRGFLRMQVWGSCGLCSLLG